MSKTSSKSECQFLPTTTRTDTRISKRTMYRQRKYDFIPKDETSFHGEVMLARTIGKDGKSYPHFKRSYKARRSSPLLGELRHVRYRLRKADSFASAFGFRDKELSGMEAIFMQVSGILARWRQATEATNEQ